MEIKRMFYNWFDPSIKDHMDAYEYLEKNGYWPEGFIPKDVEMGPVWHVTVVEKLMLYYKAQVAALSSGVYQSTLETVTALVGHDTPDPFGIKEGTLCQLALSVRPVANAHATRTTGRRRRDD